ncbi:MAG TPA: hypothetical protein DCY13_14550 [Verrucomicrobiales bacterium]|nr:hypothetical protein [Verrucomicrobiales bacterium]
MKLQLALLSTLLATGLLHADHHASPPVSSRSTLTLDGAKKVLAAAEAFARANGAGPSIAIVDEGGHLIAFTRPEGGFVAGANVSIGKARTAAIFKKPTKDFEEIVNKGRFTMTALPDFTPLQGGVPITVAGQVVGAIGVSGAKSAQQDEEVAMAGARAIAETKLTQAAQ